MTPQAQIAQLHAEFCLLVPESRCVLNMHREHEWWEWLKWRPDAPFTERDLATVIGYRRQLINKGSQFAACLKFSYIIGRPDLFEEDLSMARNLPPPKTNRQAVLEATGRLARAEKPPKMAQSLLVGALRRLRESVQ